MRRKASEEKEDRGEETDKMPRLERGDVLQRSVGVSRYFRNRGIYISIINNIVDLLIIQNVTRKRSN